MTITDDELDAIQGMVEKATEGPWVEDDGWIHSGPAADRLTAYIDALMARANAGLPRDDDQADRPETVVARCEQTLPNFEADAEFIAHARQDIPRLLSEVRRLRKENAEGQGVFDEQNAALARQIEINAELVGALKAARPWLRGDDGSTRRAHDAGIVGVVDAALAKAEGK